MFFLFYFILFSVVYLVVSWALIYFASPPPPSPHTMLVYRGRFNHFHRAQNEAIALFLSSDEPRVGAPFLLCWRWTNPPEGQPREVLYSGVIQQVQVLEDDSGIKAAHQGHVRMQFLFSGDGKAKAYTRVLFRFSDDLGTDPAAENRLQRDDGILGLTKNPEVPRPPYYSNLYVGFITGGGGGIVQGAAEGELLMLAFADGIERDKPVFVSWRSKNSSFMPPEDEKEKEEEASMAQITCVVGDVEDSRDITRFGLFDDTQQSCLFRCRAESGGDVLVVDTPSGSIRPITMAKVAGWEGWGFISKTVTLVNDSCETVRYQICNSGKHIAEELAMGILSVIPTFGIDRITQFPSVARGVMKIAEWISAGLAMKSMWHSVRKDSHGVRGLLFPGDKIQRKTTSSQLINDNDIVLERFSFEEETRSIMVTVYELSRAGEKTYYLSDIIGSEEPPARWKKTTEKWSLVKSKDCMPDRAIQIPSFIPSVGECDLRGFCDSEPLQGVIYCMDGDSGGDLPRLFPYTFTASVDPYATLAEYDSTKSSYYIQSKGGEKIRRGSSVRNLPTMSHIPVVIFEWCRLRERGSLRRVQIGRVDVDQDTDDAALMIIETKMREGVSYWGVSVDEDHRVFGYPEVHPDYKGEKWVLQKSDRPHCRTYFVGKNWCPVY